MEEEKAAAYYDELTRKGEGAAKFKQGLGFSSSSDCNLSRSSFSSTSFFNNFVRASSPGKASEIQKQAQLESIQQKLKKKQSSSSARENYDGARVSSKNEDEVSVSRRGIRDRFDHHDRGEEKDNSRRHTSSRRQHRSRSRSREDRRSHHRRSDEEFEKRKEKRRNRRSRSRSRSRSSSRKGDERSYHRSDLNYDTKRRKRRSQSRSLSPSTDEVNRVEGKSKRMENKKKVDYARLIDGYANLTPAEKVKAKMKLQLSETASRDTLLGMTTGWERFDFNQEAPLDDEEVEVAEDDAALVKGMTQSFRFSAVEAKREADIKAAHDEAMFGAPTSSAMAPDYDHEEVDIDLRESNKSNESENALANRLISEKVLAKQQGSWRDRALKLREGLKD